MPVEVRRSVRRVVSCVSVLLIGLRRLERSNVLPAGGRWRDLIAERASIASSGDPPVGGVPYVKPVEVISVSDQVGGVVLVVVRLRREKGLEGAFGRRWWRRHVAPCPFVRMFQGMAVIRVPHIPRSLPPVHVHGDELWSSSDESVYVIGDGVCLHYVAVCDIWSVACAVVGLLGPAAVLRGYGEGALCDPPLPVAGTFSSRCVVMRRGRGRGWRW